MGGPNIISAPHIYKIYGSDDTLQQGRDVVGIPGAENVRLIGKGFQGEDHFGIRNHTVHVGLSNDFHATPPSAEDFNEGITRFQRWHIDAPLYGKDPAWFTTLRSVRLPRGDDLTIEWADGSGFSMKSPPGRTAFFSTSQLYSLLSPEEKTLVDNSYVQYAPYPYKWIERCKGNSNGLGLAEGGQRLTMDELGEYDPASVKKARLYPIATLPQKKKKKEKKKKEANDANDDNYSIPWSGSILLRARKPFRFTESVCTSSTCGDRPTSSLM